MPLPKRRMTRHVHAVMSASLALLAACTESPSPIAPQDGSAEAASFAAASLDREVSLPGIALPSGGTVNLVASVFADERGGPSCGTDGTVIAVSGFTHTAATWKPLAEALFDANPRVACRVVALDLPGHGRSGLPDAIPFGILTLDDYAAALLGAMEGLAAQGIASRSLLAHSQGALVAQMAQERLLAAGTSFRASHGVVAATLLAPVPSREATWSFAESGAAAGVLQGFLVMDDPVLGPHVSVPAAAWPSLFFTTPGGVPSPTTPSASYIAASGWVAPEPLYSSLQLVGAPPFNQRPSARAGAFALANGTLLSVAAFEHDLLIPPSEVAAVYAHLTGDATGRAYHVFTGAEAIHDMHVSSPGTMLEELRELLR